VAQKNLLHSRVVHCITNGASLAVEWLRNASLVE